MMTRVCVFCGSRAGVGEAYAEAARDVGRRIAGRGIGLVYGGGNVGLMGIVADAALEAGGEVIGVIPQRLMEKELGHGGVSTLHVVDSMHERKALMARLADGFLALPGGYGTLEELCEALTWTQLGIQAKPCALLNVHGYYDPLLAMLDHAVAEGFVRPAHRALLLADAHAGRLLDAMAAWQAPAQEHWLEPSQL